MQFLISDFGGVGGTSNDRMPPTGASSETEMGLEKQVNLRRTFFRLLIVKNQRRLKKMLGF